MSLSHIPRPSIHGGDNCRRRSQHGSSRVFARSPRLRDVCMSIGRSALVSKLQSD